MDRENELEDITAPIKTKGKPSNAEIVARQALTAAQKVVQAAKGTEREAAAQAAYRAQQEITHQVVNEHLRSCGYRSVPFENFDVDRFNVKIQKSRTKEALAAEKAAKAAYANEVQAAHEAVEAAIEHADEMKIKLGDLLTQLKTLEALVDRAFEVICLICLLFCLFLLFCYNLYSLCLFL